MAVVEQAGAIPFTIKDGQPIVLLVKAQKSPREWIFPKGHIEAGESAEDAAVRELREEGGVRGKALGPAGTIEFRSGDEDVRVRYFLVRYEGEPDGGESRPRGTFDLGGAAAALAHDDARDMLIRNCEAIERHAAGRGANPAGDR
jgi:8-oxo-dGTP pyrophosphatase MutT (NUDIX family)